MTTPRFLPLGDTALSIEYGEVIDRDLSRAVLALDAAIARARLPGIVETLPSFRALMVVFDPLVTDHDSLRHALSPLLVQADYAQAPRTLWHLPVCYGGSHGPDLDAVAEQQGLSAQEIISIHSGLSHFVYMIGFLPGHPYLGDLPDSLNLPRRADPRVNVPKGSVAIAIGLTVIYPVTSPGGWNLIGRTPVPMFDIASAAPSLMAPGDAVRFHPVAADEFEQISDEVAAGRYQVSKEAVS